MEGEAIRKDGDVGDVDGELSRGRQCVSVDRVGT
jgi:hypothetical protein